MNKCTQCSTQFEITAEDKAFYKKMEVPEPIMCPDCRQQTRVSWRNESTLYPNVCGLCKKKIISIYSPEPISGREKPFVVYCQECWWSDSWSPTDFGMDYDPTKPFFEQFKELQEKVPRVAITNTNSVNSEYTNYTANNKNCYLVFANSYGHNEDCFYGTMLSKNRNCIDTIQIEDSELCYDCVDLEKCYKLVKSQMCVNCNDSYWIEDCRNCSNCFMCKGLRNKKYCILNKQYSKEEYTKILSEIKLSKYSVFEIQDKKFNEFRLGVPSAYSYKVNAENCTGDYIVNSSNCVSCFDTTDTENAHFTQYSVSNNKDVYDCSYTGGCELGEEVLSYVGGYNCVGCNIVWWDVADLKYCELCFNGTENCLGSIGLKKKKFYILNKKYNEAEYKKLEKQIIDSLVASGLYGQFFPKNLSPFGYNESVAQDYFPLTKKEALELGFNWNDRVPGTTGKGTIDMAKLADDIFEVDANIVNEMFTCIKCSKNYKILKQEFEFYKSLGLPLPRKCFNCRHLERIYKRRPRKLWHRKCANCANEFETTYAPERPDKVYCDTCYTKELL